MKIAAHSLPNHAPTRAQPPSAAPTRTFSNLLGASLGDDTGEWRAFGFNERGLISKTAVVSGFDTSAEAIARAEAPPEPQDQAAESSAVTTPPPAPEGETAIWSGSAGLSSQQRGGYRGGLPHLANGAALRPLTTQYPISPLAGVATVGVASEALEPAGIGPGAPPKPASPIPTPGRPRFVLNVQDGAARLAARSTLFDPASKQALRRAAAEVVAEFGLTLEEFHLDGDDLAALPQHIKGAADGRHPG